MVVLLLLYGAWQVFRWGPGHAELISDLSFVPVSAGAILAAWAASRRCDAQPRVRLAWRLLAFASASYLAGDLTWMLYAMLGSRPYPSAADGFYLLFYPLMLCGLLRFPARRQSFATTVRLALDIAVVAIGGVVVVIYVVLGPTLVEGGMAPLQTVFSVAYPVGDMVLLVGLASVVMRPGSSTTALRFVAAGLVCFVAADLVFGYISLHSTYHAGDPVDTLWMAAMALFAIGAAAQPSSGIATAEQEIRSASWVPYAALAIAFGLLVFSERHLNFMPEFALLLAAVVLTAVVSTRQFLAQRDLARAQHELRYQSLHDGLTHLANRRLMIATAEQMLARARRNGTSVAALYVDLDDFKRINDEFGHAAGDEVLRVVASRLSDTVRGADIVARLGGDEFVVLLGDLERADDAGEIAERINAVLQLPIGFGSLPRRDVAVSASIGVAVTSSGTTDDLLRDADSVLYQVKQTGKRNWARFEPQAQGTQGGVLLTAA